jgi:A/G-specific adenine glycosylase
MITPKRLAEFHRRLSVWYGQFGRHDLPWRVVRDPYAIWVSEIMLQQTQVKRVQVEFYPRFMESFPNMEILAAAKREHVLKEWEGLGYYRRATALHTAAILCVQEFGGQLPADLDQLLSLPGIGRNTAHAILSFGYGKQYAVCEANVVRVVARIFAVRDVHTSRQRTDLFNKAQFLLGVHDSFEFNQAMMDIGAMVCKSDVTECKVCPATNICSGKKNPLRYPVKRVKKKVPIRTAYAIVTYSIDMHGDFRFFLQKQQGEFLGGLYGFPLVDERPSDAREIGIIKHSYTHFTRVAHVCLRQVTHDEKAHGFYPYKEVLMLPLSRIDQKMLQLVAETLGFDCQTGKN